jgi:Chitobiase/beta-hexosaminidase C-terminal domain
MTQKMISLGSVLLVAVLLAALAPAARAQALLPSSITAIDARTGIVSAKVNASGSAFQFSVTNAKLLAVLHVGQGVYANLTTKQVSLDGKTMCCVIISPPQIAPPPSARAPVAKTAPGAGGPILKQVPPALRQPASTPGSAPPASVAQAPAISPAGGSYTVGQLGSGITIADATTGAVIYYTKDGSTPTTYSTKYSGPIPVSSTTTIKAMATASGMTNSAVATASYTILPPPPPTVQAAIELLTGSRDAVSSANCATNPNLSPTFNCPNGIAQSTTIRIARSAVAVSQNPPGSYSFSATLSAASLTDIPFTVPGASCALRINTAQAPSPAIVTGTLTFTSQNPGGPMNQLSLTGLQISGVTAGDLSVQGEVACNMLLSGVVSTVAFDVLSRALHDRMGDSVCIVNGPALVGPCRH